MPIVIRRAGGAGCGRVAAVTSSAQHKSYCRSRCYCDNSTCKIYILVKGSLQAELSSKASRTSRRSRRKRTEKNESIIEEGGRRWAARPWRGLPGLDGLDQEALAAELLKEQESNRGGPKPKGGGKSKMMSACAEEESTTPAAIKQLRAEAAAAEAGEEKSQLPTKRSKKMEDMGAAGAGNNLSMMGAAKCGNQMSKCAKGVKKGGKKGKQFMSRHIMERDGSDWLLRPASKSRDGPFVVTALKNTESPLVWPAKGDCESPAGRSACDCSVVQAQHNKLLEALRRRICAATVWIGRSSTAGTHT